MVKKPPDSLVTHEDENSPGIAAIFVPTNGILDRMRVTTEDFEKPT
jgi:hypothetical protein